MITLKQAIKILGLSDDDMVFLCKEHLETFAPYLSVKRIREKYDIKNTKVIRIYPYHFLYDDSLDWELIIQEKRNRRTIK